MNIDELINILLLKKSRSFNLDYLTNGVKAINLEYLTCSAICL